MSGDKLAFLEPHERVFKDKDNRPAYAYAQYTKTIHSQGLGDEMAPFMQEDVFGLGEEQFRTGK